MTDILTKRGKLDTEADTERGKMMWKDPSCRWPPLKNAISTGPISGRAHVYQSKTSMFSIVHQGTSFDTLHIIGIGIFRFVGPQKVAVEAQTLIKWPSKIKPK